MLTTQWQKSSKCTVGPCVNVKRDGDSVVIRDDKSPGIEIMTDPTSWQAFIEGVKAGEFDLK